MRSPETYVGYERGELFASPGGGALDQRRRYTAPGRLSLNQWALAGEWTMGLEATVLNAPNGRIAYAFTRATCISSWDHHDKDSPFVSVSRSMASRPVSRTAWTPMRTGTGRSPNRAFIS